MRDVSMSSCSMRLVPTKGLIVCRFWWCWPIPSNIFLLSFLCYSSPLTFSVASLQQPTIPTVATPPSTIHPPTTIPLKHHLSLFDHRIVISLTASLLLLLLLVIIMGCFLRLKFRHKRHTKKVDAVVAASNVTTDLDLKKEKDFDCTNGCVRKYNWSEIQKLSMNFSQIVGSGGFSRVYLGNLPGSNLGAIKIHCPSDYLNRVFKQELDILLQLQHDNIVKLLGYCDNQDEGALVFEYVSNGTLQDKLHGAEREIRKASSTISVLPWRNRMAIAYQLAQALEYLHDNGPLQIVHGDIKPSNILLDEQLNCKLCDFGFSKMGFSSTIMTSNNRKQVMMGSPGYTDPHYLRTGIASKKNDVYSYGVIILELATGMEAFCEERGQGQLLTSIMGPILKDIIANDNNQCKAMKLAEMVDPKLGGDFEVKEVKAMISLAALCLGQSPSLRPSATQILQTIKENIASISFLSTQQKDLPN